MPSNVAIGSHTGSLSLSSRLSIGRHSEIMKSETEEVGGIGRGRDMDRSSGNVQGASQSTDREDDEGNIYADGWLGETGVRE